MYGSLSEAERSGASTLRAEIEAATADLAAVEAASEEVGLLRTWDAAADHLARALGSVSGLGLSRGLVRAQEEFAQRVVARRTRLEETHFREVFAKNFPVSAAGGGGETFEIQVSLDRARGRGCAPGANAPGHSWLVGLVACRSSGGRPRA